MPKISAYQNIMRTMRVKSFQTFTNPLLWIIFILYVILLSVATFHHELWGDEIHSWNIAKASASFSDLISNTRYEGHPPVWYTILWLISKFTHNVVYIQLAQALIAGTVVFLILFFSPFPVITRILIPFGYFLLFEYGVLSRNYAVGVLPAFCICIILNKDFKHKILLYYVFLFLLANSHLLAMLLACSLHVYFLFFNFERKKKGSKIAFHILAGTLIFLSSLYFISPPSNSELNAQFWIDKWDIKQTIAIVQSPLRAFMPIPAWWNYNFWNTQFLLELQPQYSVLRFINPLISIFLLGMAFFVVKENKKSLILFSVNLFLTVVVSVIFPPTRERYVGFFYIGFITACWLYLHELSFKRTNQTLLNILLIIQIIGGFFAVAKDIQYPFSNSYKVKELLKEIPQNEKVVTDYWALNTLSAFADKPFYCIELNKEISFLLWNSDLAAMQKEPYHYYSGIKNLFQKEKMLQVYMISIHSQQDIFKLDPQLPKSFRVKLVDKREGAIEKSSNLYLYQIIPLE